MTRLQRIAVLSALLLAAGSLSYIGHHGLAALILAGFVLGVIWREVEGLWK